MNFWQFLDRNDDMVFLYLLVIGLALSISVAAAAGAFSGREMAETKEKRHQFIESCIKTERSTDECIKLSKEL